jgi:hypothetical protein
MSMLHSILQCAFNPTGLPYISQDQPKSPRVDKPHPASVPGTLSAVSRGAWKTIVQVVQNGSSVTDRNYWQFAKDTFNGDDVENGFL